MTSRHRPTWRFLARIRDRGDILLEALVVIALGAFVMGGMVSSALSANAAQRTAQYTDVATQAGQGVIEKAKSASWSNLGFKATQAGYSATGRDGLPTVNVATPSSALAPTSSTALRGLNFTLNTDITWKSTPESVGSSDYGVKQIAVKVSWRDKSGVTRSTTVKSTRAPTISEAVPSDVANPTGPGNNIYPSLNVLPINGGANAQLQWRAASTYSSVVVERSSRRDFQSPSIFSSGVAQATRTDASAPRGELTYYRVKAITANGQVVHSDARAIFLTPSISWASNGDILWGDYVDASARATLQMSPALSAFSTTGMAQIALADLSKVAAAQTAGYNTFRIKYDVSNGTTVIGEQLTREGTPMTLSSVTRSLSEASHGVVARWDRTASSLGATKGSVEIARNASFSDLVAVTSVASSATDVSISLREAPTSQLFVRVGYPYGPDWRWSSTRTLKGYERPSLTAVADKYTGAITATLDATPSQWDAPNATIQADDVTATIAADKRAVTTRSNVVAGGETASVRATMRNANGDSIQASASATRPAVPIIESYSNPTGTAKTRTLTLSQSMDAFRGADQFQAVAVLKMADGSSAQVDLPMATRTPSIPTNGAVSMTIRLIQSGATKWESAGVKF